MTRLILRAMIVLALTGTAQAGTVWLDLRWNGVPGQHFLDPGSAYATIELWATVSPGATVACANIAWDIEGEIGSFTILDREIAADWYDFSGDPFSGSPKPSSYFHGYFTGEGAGNSTGTFMLERYLIWTGDYRWHFIKVVASNPLNPAQLTEVNSLTGTHTVILPEPLLLAVPEPTALGLLALGSLAVLHRRHL